jgi:hypothetical protein
LTGRRPRAYGHLVRSNRFAIAVLGLSLSLAVLAAGATEAARKIKPKAGGYIGKVTNANGRDGVQLVVATFVMTPGAKPRKGPQLFQWTGILKCKDGSSHDGSSTVFAPLKGAKFSGKSKSGPQTTSLKGRFTSNTKMRGTVRLVTKGNSPSTRCDTGPVTFKAHRR